MKKPKLKIKVFKEDSGYSASTNVNDNFIATVGETYEELKENVLEAINFTFLNDGLEFNLDEIQFEFDLASFFHFYKVINAKALSERIGMNQSLLAQYITGIKKPSGKQTKRILDGVQQIGRELTEVKIL